MKKKDEKKKKTTNNDQYESMIISKNTKDLSGDVNYDLWQVPTFKTKDISVIVKISNNGFAPLNEITIIQHNFTDVYQPPKPEEIKLYWDNIEVEFLAECISIEKSTLKIQFKDFKKNNTGMLQRNSTIQFKYPIHCVNPIKDSKFISELLVTANTFPLSQELEFKPEVPTIEAKHLRRKFRVGKEVLPIVKPGQYQIKLSLENIGEMQLQTLTLMDKVPDNFEYSSFSLKPELRKDLFCDSLKWMIEELRSGEKLEITYKINGTGIYSPIEAQLGL